MQLRFRRLWGSNSRRGQRHKVGGKCGAPAVGCRFGFVASAALPVLLRLVAACQTAKQLRKFWDCGDRPRNPFFLSVCMRFLVLLQKAIHARSGFWGDVFERVFAGPNACSLAPFGEVFE